jgi:ketosteroid isomerase-like protein
MAEPNVSGASVMRWCAVAMIVAGLLFIAFQPLADLFFLSREDPAFSKPIPELPGASNIIGVIVLTIAAFLMAVPFLPARSAAARVDSGWARQIIAKLDNDSDEAFFEHVADHVKWRVIGPRSHIVSLRGKSEARARNTPLTALRSLGARLQVGNIIVEANQAAVELSAVPPATDARSVTHDCCWILSFEGGMIIRVDEYDHGSPPHVVPEKRPSSSQGE